MPGAGLRLVALKLYWGKHAVRNFRGGDGTVSIIRNPATSAPYSTTQE